MKKLLLLSLLAIFSLALSAQSFLVTVRFINSDTGLDYEDISTIQFEAELEPGSGDIQTHLSSNCGISREDVGAGVPNTFIYFDMGNFANPFSAASNVSVTIWDGANVAEGETRVYNHGVDIQPVNGMLGWGPYFGGFGGDPFSVGPDIEDTGIDWGDGVTGDVDTGTPTDPGSGPGNLDPVYGMPIENLLVFPDNVGHFFILQHDDTLLDAPITISLDTGALGYVPYNIAFYYNGMWYYVGIPLDNTAPAPWGPEVAGISEVTFTPNDFISARGKGGRAPIDIPIVFADGPLADDMLPVTLTSFLVNQAQNYGQYATIAWTVQSESNMLHYNLYRSESDLASAIKIATVNAENSSELHTYSHVDEYEIAYETTYYYWLEGVEANGVSETMANGEVYIEADPYVPSLVTKLGNNYPNPFNPETNIKYFVKQGQTASLQIYNAKGQLVQTTTLGETPADGATYKFEGSKYGSGIYFYRLKTDNYSEVKKMMMLK